MVPRPPTAPPPAPWATSPFLGDSLAYRSFLRAGKKQRVSGGSVLKLEACPFTARLSL